MTDQGDFEPVECWVDLGYDGVVANTAVGSLSVWTAHAPNDTPAVLISRSRWKTTQAEVEKLRAQRDRLSHALDTIAGAAAKEVKQHMMLTLPDILLVPTDQEGASSDDPRG